MHCYWTIEYSSYLAVPLSLLLLLVPSPLQAQGNQGIKLQQTIKDGDVTLVTEEGFLPFLPHSTWRVGILLNTPLDDPFYNVYKGLLFRGDYILPTFNTTTQHRSKRKTQVGLRWMLYSMIEEALNRAGIEGRGCFLLAVCEAAAATLHHDGLVGQILHLILTPSSTGERGTSAWHRKYEGAERWGMENKGECSVRYAKHCPSGALEHFTTIL